ncbi:MAG: response regulator [bacterium]
MTKVLLVDDEPDFIETVDFFLKGSGFEVIIASNGKEALEKVQKERPDIILMDNMMPEMDGLEACRLIKADSSLKSIPIIMLTAKGQKQDVKDALEAGANNYIVKPFNLPELVERIKKHL